MCPGTRLRSRTRTTISVSIIAQTVTVIERSWHGRKTELSNLLIAVHALHLRDDNFGDTVLTSQRSQLSKLTCNHGLISRQIVILATVPVRADAIERVLVFSRNEEFRQPGAALVDARLVLQGDCASTACTVLVAVAGAGSADFGSYGGLEGIDLTLAW